jgi:serine/threonine protein kinase
MNVDLTPTAPPASEPFRLERKVEPFVLERRLLQHPAPIPNQLIAPGTQIAERYRISSVIGSGSTGVVYKAKHIELGTPVALKVIRPEVVHDTSLWRRFTREARALGAIHNKHVVRVHDVGSLGGDQHYVVMEFLRGENLSKHLASHGPLSITRAVDIALEVCSALGDAHRHQIIHRDIKPKSVFLARYAACEPTVKLLDFGLALFLDDSNQGPASARQPNSTRASVLPCYPSPEYLVNPRQVDRRSDLFSLGRLLSDLLEGKAEVPAALTRVVQHCLEENPERRPQSAQELSAALEPFSSRRAAVRPRRRPPPSAGKAPSKSIKT